MQGANGEAVKLRGVVKWFNSVKGYGFLTEAQTGRDAFLHVTILRQIGREDVKPGATIDCECVQGPKGLQVLRIDEIDVSTIPAAAPPVGAGEPADPGEGDFIGGVVKWFNAERGYGFVCPERMEKDVFVHAAVLRRQGVELLQPGQPVRIRIGEGPKGLQVTDIRLV
jgi:cold shock protein